MTLLLDTHAFLWFVTNDPRLSKTALTLIANRTNVILVSPASFWEVAIKVSIGKYPLGVPFDQFFTQGIDGNGFSILPVEIHHAHILASLPMFHKDPFDRMLIAQAGYEKLPIVSADGQLDLYGITRIW
jgi:PIN domain nuclease of toxin-antitoxin system